MDGILFVPALLDIKELAEEFHQTLDDYFDSEVDGPAIKQVAEDELSWHTGTWIRARIPPLFHFQPPLCLGNTGDPMNVGFLAVASFDSRSFLTPYPFACVHSIDWQDYGGSSVGILFSQRGPSNRNRDRIARAFWRLCRQDPEELNPFEDYSCFGNEIFGFTGRHFVSLNQETASSEGGMTHYFLSGEQFLCYDCDGSGIEYEYPYTEDCATCGGRGTITWQSGLSIEDLKWEEYPR